MTRSWTGGAASSSRLRRRRFGIALSGSYHDRDSATTRRRGRRALPSGWRGAARQRSLPPPTIRRARATSFRSRRTDYAVTSSAASAQRPGTSRGGTDPHPTLDYTYSENRIEARRHSCPPGSPGRAALLDDGPSRPPHYTDTPVFQPATDQWTRAPKQAAGRFEPPVRLDSLSLNATKPRTSRLVQCAGIPRLARFESIPPVERESVADCPFCPTTYRNARSCAA